MQKGPQLDRYNLFFADNGRGKTTLCAVLRSLQTGECKHIIERTTIAPNPLSPEIKISFDDKDVCYKEQQWSDTASNIRIFDINFVTRNVYAGEHVNRDHRVNLLQVIIGEEGVRLNKTITTLTEDISAKTADIKRVEDTIRQNLRKRLQLNDFLNLEECIDIDDSIKVKRIELEAAEQAEQIEKQSDLIRLNVPSLPENFELILSKVLFDVSTDAKARVEEQIRSHEMHDRGQAWVSEGLDYIRDYTCPFCKQSIKGSSLIEAYNQFFSDSYTSLIKDIDQLEGKVRNVFGEVTIAKLDAIFAKNRENLQFWKSFVTLEVNEVDFENEIARRARKLHNATLVLIESKRKNPLGEISLSSEFQTARKEYQKAADILKSYNNEIVALNDAIVERKEQTKLVSLADIKKEIGDFELRKLRYSDEMKSLCDKYQLLDSEKRILQNDKDNAKQALDNYVDEIINTYQDTLNEFLFDLGADFSITNSGKKYFGKEPATVYKVVLNDQPNQPIDLGDSSTPLGKPSFRTTLSAGDKSCLALAFFLAQIKLDAEKEKRILVFDDPFSSLDLFRRRCTADFLVKYGKECAQLLLFSHDPYFLNLVRSKLHGNQLHLLKLHRGNNNETGISPWDIDEEIQSSYFKDYMALSSYLENGAGDSSLDDIARKVRPLLEDYLRYRFPSQFPKKETLGIMIKKIREEFSDTHPMRPYLSKLDSINCFSIPRQHGENSERTLNERIEDNDLRTVVRDTMNIIGGA